MNDEATAGIRDTDAVRLLGLSRVPRCAACARLEALRTAHDTDQPAAVPLPPVPADCGYQICAPLVSRFAEQSAEAYSPQS